MPVHVPKNMNGLCNKLLSNLFSFMLQLWGQFHHSAKPPVLRNLKVNDQRVIMKNRLLFFKLKKVQQSLWDVILTHFDRIDCGDFKNNWRG